MPTAGDKTVLVADDERSFRRVLAGLLKREGCNVIACSDGQEALERLAAEEVHAVITDLRMPRVDGTELLRRVMQDYPDVPVIVLTAHGSVDNAVAAVKLGAFNYLEKPYDQDQLRQVIATALRTNDLRRAEVRLGGAAKGRGRYGIVGHAAPMQAVFNVIEKVADTPSTVLITGESGTGKELVARALHEQSQRRGQPLIKVNCAAIPDSLIESELFGYERGAFTGAASAKPGRFELADQGTLFLDEIGEIPSEMQVKLLRALQEGEFERVGGIKTLKVNVRLVAATNRDLLAALEKGRFREDLYYRLNVVPIHLPPLRQRTDDIPDLVDHILEKFRQRLGREVREIEPAALEQLQSYSWPGNVRELENLLERTVLFCAGPTITLADLLPAWQQARPAAAALQIAAAPATAGPPPPRRVKANASLKEIVRAETERVERDLIAAALDETGGNVTHAAKRLKISRKSLQNKMKELGLRDRDLDAQAGKRVD